MTEEWRAIEGFERYEVSDLGRVRNAQTGRVLACNLSTQGYPQVHLFRPKPDRPKTFKVHRIVARTFIPNPDNLPEVNHKDCCKTNNAVTNLEWVDRMGNYWHAHAAGIWHGGSNPNRNTKFSRETIAEVRARHAAGATKTISDLAREYGMTESYCNRVIHGKLRKRG